MHGVSSRVQGCCARALVAALMAARLRTLAAAATAPVATVTEQLPVGAAFPVWAQLGIPHIDQEAALPLVRELGYDSQSIHLFHADVNTLGPAEILRNIPQGTGLPAKAALSRILDVVSQKTQPAWAASGPQEQGALEQLLVSAGLRQSDPQRADQERQRQRANLSQLIHEAGLGHFAGEILPEPEQLRIATSAAGVDQFPDFAPSPDRTPDGRALASHLLSLLKTGLAAVFAWRMTPAALISELGIALEIALEPSLAVRDAEVMAIKYSERVRKLLHTASLSESLPADPTSESFKASMAVFLKRDPALFAETRDSLGIQTVRPQQGAQRASQPAGNPQGSQSDACLRFATADAPECASGNRTCTYAHVCPYCAGAKCGNRPGYLSFHLGKLRTPLQLVRQRGAQHAPGRGSGPARSRSRSRSRSPARRRQPQWGRQAEPQVRPKEEEDDGPKAGRAAGRAAVRR